MYIVSINRLTGKTVRTVSVMTVYVVWLKRGKLSPPVSALPSVFSLSPPILETVIDEFLIYVIVFWPSIPSGIATATSIVSVGGP